MDTQMSFQINTVAKYLSRLIGAQEVEQGRTVIGRPNPNTGSISTHLAARWSIFAQDTEPQSRKSTNVNVKATDG